MFTCRVPEMLGDGSAQARLLTNDITFLVDIDDNVIPGYTRADLVDLVFEAWRRWERRLAIFIDIHTNAKTKPTQRVTAHNFGDGPYGILADQQLPYGRSENLLMRIDIASSRLSREQFTAMLCHENGHCLGMAHSSPTDGVSDLMDPALSKIVQPTDGDIIVATKMGYGRAGTAPKPPSPQGPFGRIEVEIEGVKYEASGLLRKVG